MKRNMSEREDFEKVESDKMTVEVDDVLIQSIEGVIIGRDNDEIKLLFSYLMPESYLEENYIKEFKDIAELRGSCSKFMDISREINEKMKEIKKGRYEIAMFG